MKVLLVQPPIEDFYDTPIRTYPLALLYLAAAIKDVCDVSVADFRSNKKRMLKAHPFPELTAFYRRDAYTPLSLFHSYYRFGMSREEIRTYMQEDKPDVVAISSLFTTYAEEALDVAAIAKQIDPAIVTIMGGTHPTVFPRHCLSSPFVDYVVRGEGETPLNELIGALDTGERGLIRIPGVCSKDRAGMHISQISFEDTIDLTPERRLINSRDYRIARHTYSFMLTSRGCPFHCAFCGKPPVPYRRREIGSIEKEIEDCRGLNIRAIDFEDDMLNLDLKSFRKVLELFQGTGIELSAMNGLYAGTLDKETLELMYDAGFRRLNFSLVDASHAVHHAQQRVFPAHFTDLLSYLESSPFVVEAHFILGLPGQRHDDIIETMIFLMERRLLAGPSVYYLAPTSPLFHDSIGGDWERYLKVMRSSALYPSNPLFPRETTATFVKLTRFINMVKGMVDRNPAMERLSDIAETECIPEREHDVYILKSLLSGKRFISYDVRRNEYVEEPQDRDLVSYFFRKIHGKTIRGFKTPNRLTVDI